MQYNSGPEDEDRWKWSQTRNSREKKRQAIGIKDTIPGNEATRITRSKNVVEISYTKADGTKESLPVIMVSSGKHRSFIVVKDSVPKVTESDRASGGSITIGPVSNGPTPVYYVDGVEM